MREMQRLENALISLARGDNEALSVIYDSLSRMIFSLALGITENYSDAEDVLQETMIDTVKYSHSYRTGTNPRAFILSMARHNAIDLVRRRREHLSIDDSTVAELADGESLYPLSRDIKELLGRLDADERQIIILRIYGELSFAEAAKTMEISVFAAQKRYQRALKKLRSISGGDFG